MNGIPRLIAIGGGGFTHGSDPVMEDFILAQVTVTKPRVGYIGTANHDDPVRVAAFHSRFDAVTRSHSHLPTGAKASDVQNWLAQLDIVYVGGGNTIHLREHWRTSGIANVMISAARRGVLMAGVNAGVAVWFDQALSDSGDKGLAPISGIGMIRGSCCPHYSTEPQRQSVFMASVAQGEIADGLAIDDGVAVLIHDAKQLTTFSARAGATARRVRRIGGTAVCETV